MKAADFMKQLENDPAYQERIRKREAELQLIWDARTMDEAELVREIRGCGYEIESIYDLVNNFPHPLLERKFIGAYSKAYPVLLKHLNQPHEKIIRQGIIRALTEKDVGREIEESLFENFKEEKDADTKWVLANALKTVIPYNRRRNHPEIANYYKTKSEQGGADKPHSSSVPRDC